MTVDPQRYERIGELFHAAAEMSPEKAKEFLDRMCAGDEDLREEVTSLLAHDPQHVFSGEETSPSGPVRSALVSLDSEGNIPGAMSWIFGQQAPEAVGKRFGDFEIKGEVGRGGMGVVFEARQVSLDRRVALKVLPPVLSMSPGTTIRFEREARASARLKHPNIVSVHAIGEAEGYHYYAMEFIDGVPLSRILDDLSVAKGGQESKEGNPPEPIEPWRELWAGKERFITVARLVAEVADGLHYAHEHGVIHRDIKPGNLLWSKEGRLMISDFGLARVAGDPRMTQSGTFQGTVGYMSPEQIAAGRMKLDHRTDVYSLGTVLYEMLTLVPPFDGTSREEVVSAVLTTDPDPPRKLDRRIPRDLETICLHALEKNPARRYATAGQMAEDLRKFLAGNPIAAGPPGWVMKLARWRKRHPVLAGCAVAGILGVIAGFVAAMVVLDRQNQERIREAEAHFRARLEYLRRQQRMETGGDTTPPERIRRWSLPEEALVRAWAFWSTMAQKGWDDKEGAGLFVGLEDASRDPKHGWAAELVLAEIFRQRNPPQTEKAQQIEARALQRMPFNAEAQYIRSFTTSNLTRNLSYAINAISESRDGDEVLQLARERVAGLYLLLGKHPEALQMVRILVASEKESADRHQLLGRVLALNRRYEEAKDELTKAIQLEPDNYNLYMARAGVFLCLKDLQNSIEDYDRLIKKGPVGGSVWWFYHRATPLWMKGRYYDAAQDYNRVINVGAPLAVARKYLLLMDEALELEKTGKKGLASAKRQEAGQGLLHAQSLKSSEFWKMDILKCLAGKKPFEKLIEEAKNSQDLQKFCEASYYAGEDSRLRGQARAAKQLFTQCVDTGLVFQKRTWFDGGFDVMNEWHLARWRLDQMGARGDGNQMEGF